MTILYGPCLSGRYMGYLHNCNFQSSHVGRIYSKSKTEPNMSEYRARLPISRETKAF